MINKGTPLFRSRSIVALCILFVPSILFCQTVNITILVNTATVPDTIRSTAFVQMRGNRLPLTADSTSPVIFSRIAGDYWKATAAFMVHDTVDFAFFVNGHRDWHSGLEAPPLRRLIVGTKDSTLPLQYVFGSVKDTNQYWRPFAETDSIEILFRVNMEFQEDFRDEQRIAAVRGSFPSSKWGTSIFLTKEKPHALPGSRGYDAGNFWSGVVRVPRPDSAITIEYTYVQHIGSDVPTSNPLQWEYINEQNCSAPDVKGNRFVRFTKWSGDTTLSYRYWANADCKKSLQRDTVIISFTTNLTKALQARNYIVGDSLLLITGLRNTNTILHTLLLKKPTLSFDYIAVDTLIFFEGFKPRKLFYKYVYRRNGKDFEDSFIDYAKLPDTNYTGRFVDLTYTGATQYRTVKDTSRSIYTRDRMPSFKSDRRLAQNVLFKIVCDLHPPWVHLLNSKDTLFSRGAPFVITHWDSIYRFGVWINGTGLDSKGWLPWGETLHADASRKLYDDGTHGDAFANDRMYTGTFMLYKDSSSFNSILKEFKFGINGYDNETGKDVSISHFVWINDASSSTLVEEPFGIQFPTYLSRYNYEHPYWEERVERTSEVANAFALKDNFPNPFNPSTTITFSIGSSSRDRMGFNESMVTLIVFDLLGRKVATLVNERLIRGTYTTTWNAQTFSSGIYLYRLQADDFIQTRRMLLLK